jgi:hypothetical protein
MACANFEKYNKINDLQELMYGYAVDLGVYYGNKVTLM